MYTHSNILNIWDILSYQNACDNPIFFIHLIVKSHKKERLHFARVKKIAKRVWPPIKIMMLIEKYDFSKIQKGLLPSMFVIKVKIEHFSMKHFSRKSSFFIMVNSLELWWNSIVVVCGGEANLLASFEMTSGKK